MRPNIYYQDEDPFYNAIRDNFAFTDIFPVDEGQNIYNLNQGKNTITNKVDAKVDYYWVTGQKSNLNFTLGTTQSRSEFRFQYFSNIGWWINIEFYGNRI